MNFTKIPQPSLRWLAIASLCWSALAAKAAEKNLTSAQLVIPKSVFVDDLKTGKDPFFPYTARRVEKVPLAPTSNGTMPIQPRNLLDQVLLKGISGTGTRRFALINNHTFEVGEQAEVKTNEGKIKIRCLEIRDRSVVVSVAGELQRRELALNEKL